MVLVVNESERRDAQRNGSMWGCRGPATSRGVRGPRVHQGSGRAGFSPSAEAAVGSCSKRLSSRIVIPLWNNGVMTQTSTERLHIVEGSDWKDAVIALLESRSPYRPWRYGFGEAKEGDPVAVVLNTDPPSVMTALGRIGSDGQPDRAVVDWPLPAPGLIELTTLVMMVGFEHDQDPRDTWQLRGDAANRMHLALTECQYRHDYLCGSGIRPSPPPGFCCVQTVDAPDAMPASS